MSASWGNIGANLAQNQSMPTRKQAAAAAKPAQPAAAAAAKPAQPAAAPAAAAKPAPAAAAAAKAAPAAAAAAPAAAAKSAAAPAKAASPAEEKKEVDPNAPKPRVYQTGYALVKSVPSGDSIVVQGTVQAGVIPPEKNITLTGVNAPKFAKGKAQEDEPFAWESREYLRKLLIGQQVAFSIQHTDEKSGRDYGTITWNGQNVTHLLLRAGWVSVKTPKDGKTNPEREELLSHQKEAEAKGLGVHNKKTQPKDHIRQIDWTPDTLALYQANKATPLPAVVDYVRDGSTLRVELIHPQAPLKHTMINLNLSGIVSPRTAVPLSVLIQQWEKKKEKDPSFKEKKPTKQEASDPFADEAQVFTEQRLLNREVHVLLQGVDKTGNLFGTVSFAKGNISVKLLEAGLAKYVAWSASLTGEADKLRAAEAQAKAAKLRLWKDYVAGAEEAAVSANAPAVGADWQGKVLQVVSGDSVVVEGKDAGSEIRVRLASIRAPRFGNPREKSSKDEPFAHEAKEFLRSRLIGHKVRCVVDYVKAARENGEAQVYATVFQNKTNVNEAIVANGFATAIPHRIDEPRSAYYDLFLAAENKAVEAGKGIHDKKAASSPAARVVDLTERIRPAKKGKKGKKADGEDGAEEEKEEKVSKADEERENKRKQLSSKAKQYLVFLQREKQNPGVVEYVFSASRFKLLVPKEHILISFALSGIRTPGLKTADGKDDPLALEVLNYVRSKTLQYSAKFEVETIDKGDNFLGSLFVNRTNLAVDLLQQGYAQIFGYSAKKSPYAQELYQAERQAKAERRGVWKDYVEPVREEKTRESADDESDERSSDDKTDRRAKITEIVDCTDFFISFIGDKNAEAIAAALEEIGNNADSTSFEHPGKDRFVAAGQFNDGSWHRVAISGTTEDGEYRAYFMDFGNWDFLSADSLRNLPAEVAKIPGQAIHCALSGLRLPSNEEYRENSALAFSDMAFGVELAVRVDFSDRDGKKHVTLTLPEHPDQTVNKQLLRDGWAKVNTRVDRKFTSQLDSLREEERYAKQNHYNIWEYGDIDEEDDSSIKGPDPTRPKRA